MSEKSNNCCDRSSGEAVPLHPWTPRERMCQQCGEEFDAAMAKSSGSIQPRVTSGPMKYVYVAGPMSKGDLLAHVRDAIAAGDQIIAAGGIPFLPQICVLWEIASPKSYETWLRMDLAWIERMDCLVRLPGESSGADREVEHARSLGKPVFFGIEAYLAAWI